MTAPAPRRAKRKNPLAELLTRLRFESTTASSPEGSLAIAFRHRGAPGDVREVTGVEIERADRHGVALADGTTVPLHRVLEVRRGAEVLWKRGPSPDSTGTTGSTAPLDPTRDD